MTISLEKRAEKVGIILAKKGITKIPPVRVGLALDHSGSAEGFYTSGQMQETVERLMGVAMKFDDNSELDLWYFHNTSIQANTVTPANMADCVNRTRRETGVSWGGTSYAPIMSDMVDFYFPNKNPNPVQQAASGFMAKLGGLFGGGKPAASAVAEPVQETKPLPAYGIFVTDGASGDPHDALRVLQESGSKNMYWTLVGLGHESQFGMLKQAADQLDNVGFVNLNNLSLSDDDLYEKLITDEVVAFLKKQG